MKAYHYTADPVGLMNDIRCPGLPYFRFPRIIGLAYVDHIIYLQVFN